MPPLVTRFAPSPTGHLHIGGARSALFCWAYARKNSGRFMLRIEDTDASRTKEEWVDKIGETLTWFGLDWDETPWRQSERIGDYVAAADALIASGHAYECYDTPEELEEMNAARRAAKQIGRAHV